MRIQKMRTSPKHSAYLRILSPHRIHASPTTSRVSASPAVISRHAVANLAPQSSPVIVSSRAQRQTSDVEVSHRCLQAHLLPSSSPPHGEHEPCAAELDSKRRYRARRLEKLEHGGWKELDFNELKLAKVAWTQDTEGILRNVNSNCLATASGDKMNVQYCIESMLL
ncbi:hypothetical protein U9M48_028760 [Paspalum notatum var. saurae]|uniref:Uncharacterized protein n=1 Tax=Paspalum notatum var. saurae TaxID=547442 RepID=A0AAQ3TW47_PASNO